MPNFQVPSRLCLELWEISPVFFSLDAHLALFSYLWGKGAGPKGTGLSSHRTCTIHPCILYIKLSVLYHGSFVENIWIIEPINFHVHNISKTISFNYIHMRLPFSLVISRTLTMTLIPVMMQTRSTWRPIRSKGFMTLVRVILRLRVLLSWTSIHLSAILRQMSLVTVCTDRFRGSMLNGIHSISFESIRARSKESVHQGTTIDLRCRSQLGLGDNLGYSFIQGKIGRSGCLDDSEYKWTIRGWECIEKDHGSEVIWQL